MREWNNGELGDWERWRLGETCQSLENLAESVKGKAEIEVEKKKGKLLGAGYWVLGAGYWESWQNL